MIEQQQPDRAGLDQLLVVAPGPDGTWQGRCLAGIGGRIFGGHALALAIVGACGYTQSGRAPTSMHAIFIGPGNPDLDVTFGGETLKLGRSMDLVTVHAWQAERTLFTAVVSCKDSERGDEFLHELPVVPGPDQLTESLYAPEQSRAAVLRPFEIRYATPHYRDDDPAMPTAELDVWVRTRCAVEPSDAISQSALLAYATDLFINRGIRGALRRPGRRLLGASLDHAVWFHRPFDVNEWLLLCCRGLSYSARRAFSHALVFDAHGALVASAAQEVLLRPAQ